MKPFMLLSHHSDGSIIIQLNVGNLVLDFDFASSGSERF